MFNILHYISAKFLRFIILKSGGQRYTNCVNKMKSSQAMKVGDKVIFDNDKIEVFKGETRSPEKSVQQYQQLVLSGVNQIGIVKELGLGLTTISYQDGWELPVPTKYLIILDKM